jgi:hypothetical protein
MSYPLKTVSQLQIEEALAHALSNLTGASFTVNIRKMEFTGNCLRDTNAIELTADSDYCDAFAKEEETAAVRS